MEKELVIEYQAYYLIFNGWMILVIYEFYTFIIGLGLLNLINLYSLRNNTYISKKIDKIILINAIYFSLTGFLHLLYYTW